MQAKSKRSRRQSNLDLDSEFVKGIVGLTQAMCQALDASSERLNARFRAPVPALPQPEHPAPLERRLGQQCAPRVPTVSARKSTELVRLPIVLSVHLLSYDE